ncbi:MAG: hypothetical protein HYW34_02855 [Candidatus Brennerbacteria bacterium]|nr:hypothetical protein [Candidatus Brennerbacteria bacterium]
MLSNYLNLSINWLKSHKREILLFFLLFLISSISFGLGYLTRQELNQTPIIIQKNSEIPIKN